MNFKMSEEARLSARLQELRGEFARGEAQMTELDQRRATLRDTLLRINGAIQVLEELLQPDTPPAEPTGEHDAKGKVPALDAIPVSIADDR